MAENASIESPEDLEGFYSKIRYRILNKDTNRPFFNTKFDTFDKWHLLSPEQMKKHKIGICYDTAAMTDKVLKDLGIEHKNYFAHSDDAKGWENDPTHAFNVYKDKGGDWRWLEGSWGKYKGNDWKDKSRRRLVKKIVKALADESGQRQKLHEVDEFPAPGISMKDWYEAMSKMPVKKASIEIKDGDYASVKSVYDSLSNKEKNYVTPGRRIYKDIPKNLVSRSVAYDRWKPVAFTDIVGMFPHGTAAFETAVDSEHRGNGLSEKLSIDALKKVLKRVKENREKKPEDREKWAKIKRFAWDVLDGNDASAHIAGKLKFKERRRHPDGWRRFIMSYGDAERLYGEKSAEYAPSEEELRRIYEVLQADARLDGKVSGLGFGRGGDAYRRAAAKLRVMELVKVLQDGKRIRNRIVHSPGYIPSERDAERAIGEYGDAEKRLSEIGR